MYNYHINTSSLKLFLKWKFYCHYRQNSCDDYVVMTRQYSYDEQRPLLSRQESSDDHRVPSLSNIQKVPSISDLTDDGKAGSSSIV